MSRSFKQNQRPILQISSKRLAKCSRISYVIAFMTMKIWKQSQTAVTTSLLSKSTFKKGFKTGTTQVTRMFAKLSTTVADSDFYQASNRYELTRLCLQCLSKKHKPKINEAYSWLQYNANKTKRKLLIWYIEQLLQLGIQCKKKPRQHVLDTKRLFKSCRIWHRIVDEITIL